MKFQIFLDIDLNLTSLGWNTTSPMTLAISPDIPHGQMMKYTKFKKKLLGHFEEDFQFFPFNPIWLPYHVTYDVRVMNNILSMGSPSDV